MMHYFARVMFGLGGLLLCGQGLSAGSPCCGTHSANGHSQHVFVLQNDTDATLTLELVSGWEQAETIELAAGASVTLKSQARTAGTHTTVSMKVTRGGELLGSATSTLMDMYYGRGGVTVEGAFQSGQFTFRRDTFAVTSLNLRYPPGHLLPLVKSTQEIQRKLISEKKPETN